MFKLNLIALAIAAVLAAPACAPDEVAAVIDAVAPAPAPYNPDPADDCTTEQGWDVDGTLVVTVLHTQAVPCDLTAGMQLNLVWNAETEGEGWGGDASVAAAEQAALDAGCTPHWYNDGEFRLVGDLCDF